MQPSDLSRPVHPRRIRRVGGAIVGAGLLASLVMSIAASTFDPDLQPTGWVTRPALTSNDLKSGSEVIFRSDYRRGPWTGTVRANHIDAAGEVSGSSPWSSDTATLLAGNHWNTGRRIVTRGASAGVPFRWGSLSSSQQTALGGSTTGPKVLDFVRGDRSNENPSGVKFRARESVQGDIQHATLVHWRHDTGVTRLYAGGNDGMLHAFDATTGQEVFAYIPSMLVPRLPRLTADPYAHTLFVDGGIKVAEVTSGTTVTTLLAGALGGGGKGLYMLDVSNPSPADEAAAAALVKWEITPASSGFANLGYTYAAPTLVRLNNGVAAVVVGNGYMNGGNGRATLLLINASTGALIREIDTGSGSTGSPNGLSTATTVDTDLDGKVDFAYAGDIDGNLWRFDLRGSDPAAYGVSKLLTTSPAQAITIAPVVANHPLGGRMVLFATGRMLTTPDATDGAAHYAYGLWDGAPVANTAWLDQSITEVTSGGQRLRQVSNHAPNWAGGGHKGWRLALTSGERVIGEGQFMSDDRFYFTTTNPTVAAAGEGLASGSNWLMEVNYLTGGSPPSAIFDISGDNKIDAADDVGGAVVAGKHLGAGVSSQAVLADLTAFSMTLFNRQSDLDYTVTPATGDPGVSGGHFDVDFFFTSGTSFGHVKHVHEYDDAYDVTGVNFLNASDPGFNLGTKLPVSTPFKVLVMNQYLNPASRLSIGGAPFVAVKDFLGQANAASADDVFNGQPADGYVLGGDQARNVNTLSWKLPLDAFKSKDWWGDGGAARAGLIPTQTGCVNKVKSDGSAAAADNIGPNGERHDGAMTVQIVKANTPASVLEMNYSGGGPKYGWRVKAANFKSFVLAEYTTFWHHPNGKCYGEAGWVADAPQDFDGSTSSKTRAAGSADPKEGTFGIVPAGVTVVSTTSTVVGDTTTIVVTYSDGKTETTVIVSRDNGSETVTMTGRDGSVTTGTRMSAGSLGRAPEEILQGSRRINWREVIRQ